MTVAWTFDVVVLIKRAIASIEMIGAADVAQRTLGVLVAGIGTIALGRRATQSPKQPLIVLQRKGG